MITISYLCDIVRLRICVDYIFNLIDNIFPIHPRSVFFGPSLALNQGTIESYPGGGGDGALKFYTVADIVI